MQVADQQIIIPVPSSKNNIIAELSKNVEKLISANETPVRFAVTKTDSEYHCELTTIKSTDSCAFDADSIFNFQKRAYQNNSQYNAALIIPTGIGAVLGGHSGDGGALCKFIANACDTLITHPNVVNAADINEMPANTLYVEGSVLSRLLMGTIGLSPVNFNRVMLVMDKHTEKFVTHATVNSVLAARVAMGLSCPQILTLPENISVSAHFSEAGTATGKIENFDKLATILADYKNDYDAVALTTMIDVDDDLHEGYFTEENNDMVNPWGGVEAMLTHAVSSIFNIPSAHSPMVSDKDILDLDVGIVDPRKAAEAVSTTYLHCILKGLHASPKIISDPPKYGAAGMITANDISCIIMPYGCLGLPTLAALEQEIPVIAVKENSNCMQNKIEDLPFKPDKLFVVENYLEAVGVMTALKTGVAIDTIRRPINTTKIVNL